MTSSPIPPEAVTAARPSTVLGEAPTSRKREIGELFRPHLSRMGAGVLWLLVTNAMSLLMPRLINEGITVAEGGGFAAGRRSVLSLVDVEVPSAWHIVGALLACAVIGGVVRVQSRVVLFNVGRDVERGLRADLYRHLATLSPSFFKKSSIGDLMSRLTNDMTNVRLMSGFALLNIANAVIVFCATLPILLLLDVKVALLSLAPFPLVLASARVVTRVMFKRTKENQEALGAVTAAVQENLAGQAVVRAFSREDGEQRRFGGKSEQLYQAAMRLATVRLAMGPVMGLMASLGIGVALYAGGAAIVEGRLEVGDVIEINTRLVQLAWPTIALGFVVSVYQRGRASLERINEVFVQVPDIVDGPVDRAVEGAVSARGLTVVLDEGKPPVLRGVDIELPPSKVLGVVGKNASGKSTLVRALARQVVVPRGQLLLDGVDVNDWHLRALHEGVGTVPEDGFLFSTSLFDNLAFGRPDATRAEVEAVVDLVDLRRDVDTFPDKLETVVGERGVTLSGGQRQRVSLGRALLARPRVLLLDDCLSAVDSETEANIVRALRRGFDVVTGAGAPPTLVVVSHRLSAVKDADEIIALQEGAIVERGTHEELLRRGGLYAELWGEEQRHKHDEATATMTSSVPSTGGVA